MIRDFNDFDHGATFESDICIIGAGAAGITIAREFLGTHYGVLLLESGGLQHETESQKLYDSYVVGLPHAGIHEGRFRLFGGSTTVWGGQSLRFSAFDLQERPWVPFSGWPIPYETLASYYPRADRVLRLGRHLEYENVLAGSGLVAPAFDPNKLRMEFSQWSPQPNFGRAFRRELNRAANISVLLHANVTAIVTNSGGTAVEQADFTTLSGKKGSVRARFFIICCGGIETARLLLASDRTQPCGVGNQYDIVGRYFHEHVFMRVGAILAQNRRQLQNYYESFFIRGLKYAPIISLKEQMQIEKHLLSIHGIIAFEAASDSSIVAIKKIYGALIRKTPPSAREMKLLMSIVLREPGELTRFGYRRCFQGRAGTPNAGLITMTAQSEMAPNPESRITLDQTRDSLGMRRVKLDWRLGELERRTISEFGRIVASEFERINLGTFERSQLRLLEDSPEWHREAHDSFHHMGATRMNDNPRLGVVDSDCRVHGVTNLYIGSSSVFPTGGRTSPTLTIIALSLRIADRLKQLA